MPIIGSVLRAEGSAGGEGISRSLISGVNAHLRIPRDPADFRVVLTFHHTDGTLCEAELMPNEAAGLMAEIGRAIDQGSTSELRSPQRGEGERRG